MSGIVENYNQDVLEVNKNLNVMKKAGASYSNILESIAELKEKFTESMVEVRLKKENLASFKDEKMKKVEKVQAIVQEKEKKIKKLNEQIEQYENVAKKVISEIKFKNLKKVKKDQSVENLFRFFYVNLYYEHQSTFNYDKFVKIAL